MKTLHDLQSILGCQAFNQIPKCYKTALTNSQILESATCKNKLSSKDVWDKTYNSLKRVGKKKRIPSCVRFGEAKFYEKKNPQKVVKTECVSDKFGREITSGPIMEQYVYQHLVTLESIWEISPCGTHESLMDHLMRMELSLEQLSIDLKKIWSYVRKMRFAVLGYKSSWKINYEYDEFAFNPWRGPEGEWEKTGKKMLIAPQLRMYLMKVVKDQEMSAMMIQAYYRRYRAMKSQ